MKRRRSALGAAPVPVTLLTLPEDVLVLIAQQVRPEVMREPLRQVCKRWRRVLAARKLLGSVLPVAMLRSAASCPGLYVHDVVDPGGSLPLYRDVAPDRKPAWDLLAFVQSIVSDGCISLLRWAHLRGFLSPDTVAVRHCASSIALEATLTAMRHGRLDALRYLRNECHVFAHVLAHDLAHGSSERTAALIWLVAASGGHVPVMRWLDGYDPEWPRLCWRVPMVEFDHALMGASIAGHLDAVEWLLERTRRQQCSVAAMLNWARLAATTAANYGHLHVLRRLFQRYGAASAWKNDYLPFVVNEHCVKEVASAGHVDVLRYLLSNEVDDEQDRVVGESGHRQRCIFSISPPFAWDDQFVTVLGVATKEAAEWMLRRATRMWHMHGSGALFPPAPAGSYPPSIEVFLTAHAAVEPETWTPVITRLRERGVDGL